MEEIKYLYTEEEMLNLPNSWEEKGIKKGKKEEKRDIALNMLKKGLSEELIEEVTNLEKSEIEKLRKSL